MLVKRSLVWVALLFLTTTVFLFLHLQNIGIGSETDLTNESSEIITNKQSSSENFEMDSSQDDKYKEENDEEKDIASDVAKNDEEEEEEREKEEKGEEGEEAIIENKRNFNDVHVFYYPWYANVETDGKWNHWDHHILPHWVAGIKVQV